MSGAHTSSWWGAFDPYSFGVWLSEDKIHDFPDPNGIHRLYLRSFYFPLDDDHCRYVNNLPTLDLKVRACIAFTSAMHEWRHWYDAISTPFGITRTAQLAGFYASGLGLERVMMEHKNIFVPISKWAKYSDLISEEYPNIKPPGDGFLEAIEKFGKILEKADFAISASEDIDDLSIGTVQILEGLALLTQEVEIARVFGENLAQKTRESLKANAIGEKYYTAIEIVERHIGDSRSDIIRVLETSLFLNYGVCKSMDPLTPPIILKKILQSHDLDRNNISASTDNILFDLQGFYRRLSLQMTINTAMIQFKRIKESVFEDVISGMPASISVNNADLVKIILSESLEDAVIRGSLLRYPSKDLPLPTLYTLPPPIFIEGFPGRLGPLSDQMGVRSLASIDFPSFQIARESLSNYTNATQYDKYLVRDEPYRLSVVWTAYSEDYSFKYFNLFDIFEDMMFWRVLHFGPGGISPYTFDLTAKAMADRKGISLNY